MFVFNPFLQSVFPCFDDPMLDKGLGLLSKGPMFKVASFAGFLFSAFLVSQGNFSFLPMAHAEMSDCDRFLSVATNLKEWEALAEPDKFDALRNEYLEFSEEKQIDDLQGEEKALAKIIVDAVASEGLSELQDYHYNEGFTASVGDPEQWFQFARLPNGELAGARIRIRQNGVGHPDGTGEGTRFSTLQEAIDEGWDPNDDVSWTANGVFDHQGNALDIDPDFSWD